MNPVNALNIYKNVGLESGVTAASPHQLILMLYQGALLAIASAKKHMVAENIAAKGASITKAIQIIDEGLKACLDLKQSGEIGRNLYDLYDYMNQRLLIANLKNDIAMLDEVSGLLNELKGAWESIRPTSAQVLSITPPSIAPAAMTQTKQEIIPASTIGRQAVLMYGRM